MERSSPALTALICGITILTGVTLRSFIPTSVSMRILTFAATALIQSPTGINVKNSHRKNIIPIIIAKIIQSSMFKFPFFYMLTAKAIMVKVIACRRWL
jgi:hypothetical protein